MQHHKTIYKIFQRIPAFVAAFFLVFGLTGCGSTLKKPKAKPAKLVKLAQNQSSLNLVFSDNLGSGDKKDPLKLKVAKVGDRYAAASRNGKLALYDSSGKTLWRKSLGADITAGVSASEKDGGSLVVADAKGRISAFGLDGSLKWQTSITGVVLAPALISSERVVVSANNGVITGLNFATGEVSWKFTINIPAFSLRGMAAPVALTDSIAVIASADGRIHAIRTDTGVPLWSRRVSASGGRSQFERLNDTDADPVYFNKVLYTASFQAQALGIDMDTRSELFQLFESSTKTPAVDASQLYIVTTTSEIKAFDRLTGAPRWQSKQLLNRGLSNPVVYNGVLFVGDEDGYIHSINAGTGKLIGRTRTSGAANTLKLADDVLMSQTQSDVVSVWQIAHTSSY